MISRRSVLTAGAAGVLPLRSARAEALASDITVLRLGTRSIEVNGKPAEVYGIRQPDGRFGYVGAVGRNFRVRVENGIDAPSLIHWHGMAPPWQQDGVPGISGPPIAPGASAEYDFPLRFGGTFWMHSHQGLQEQRLMSAPLIIRDARDRRDQQEVLLFLADFSFRSPEEIFDGLRKAAMAPMAAGMPTMHPASPKAAMPAPDLNDVRYDAFLANDRTLADPDQVAVEPGGRVLLRVINGSSMSAYTLDLGRLTGELTAVDGFPVRPVRGRTFPITVAQRLEIRLALPPGAGVHPVLATLEGERSRTGLVLRAGNAPLQNIDALAAAPSPALTLDLERRLTALAPLRRRPADRVHKLDLTGTMAGYVWSINGVAWTPAVPPLPIARGERVELVLTNRTPMPHPMHLHGHQFQVVAIDGQRFAGAVRDTVLVPPGRQVTIAFDADNPGWWAFHCHLLYHLEAGMFTTLRYV